MKTLSNIKKDLVDKKETDPESSVLQVIGLNGHGRVATADDFTASFKHMAERTRDPERRYIPSVVSLVMEKNYELDKDWKLMPATEWFIKFKSGNNARYAYGMKDFHLSVKTSSGSTGFSVKCVKPTQDLATRETYREIGMLVDRIKEIEKEVQSIGGVRENGCGPYKLSDKYIDKSYFLQDDFVPKYKRTRAAGHMLEYHPYVLLKCKRPVDSAKLIAQMKELYNEECDALIKLREFQINGVEFEF
jgi:hypothetical protein